MSFRKKRIELPLLNSGILRDKTMDDKLMYIPNDDKQYKPFCRLDYWLAGTQSFYCYSSFGYQCNIQTKISFKLIVRAPLLRTLSYLVKRTDL